MVFIQNLLQSLINAYNTQSVVDPKIINYIVSIMDYKNKQLPTPAFGRITIAKLSEKFLNIPNAAAVKTNLPIPFLYLTATTVDILEHGVLGDTQTYTLTCIDPHSPYTLKVTMPQERAERMIWALVEHELGHLYHPHHCRLYAPTVITHMIITIAFLGYAFYNKFIKATVLPTITLPIIGKVTCDWPSFILGFTLYYLILVLIPQYTNSSFTASHKWEQEADEFITNDKDILQGAIAFETISMFAKTYIYSYSNWRIKWKAWLKGMDCAQFVQTYPEQAHSCFEKSSSLGIAFHPMSSERIARLQQRIDQLPVSDEPQKSSLPITLKVYHGTKVVKESTI